MGREQGPQLDRCKGHRIARGRALRAYERTQCLADFVGQHLRASYGATRAEAHDGHGPHYFLRIAQQLHEHGDPTRSPCLFQRRIRMVEQTSANGGSSPRADFDRRVPGSFAETLQGGCPSAPE